MKTREKLYNTLVRPHLEYAASVWDPHVTKHKQAIEKVQRRAARWVTNQHTVCQVSQLCCKNWTGNHWNSDVPTPALAYCTKLQMVLWPHHTFLISSPTFMLLVHHDMRTHCNMRHTNAGQTILNILTSLIQ